MRKPNALYLKRKRLIAEPHRQTERHTQTHKQTHTNTHTQIHTKKRTQTLDTYKELLQRCTLPLATHMNHNKLLLQKRSNIVPTQFI